MLDTRLDVWAIQNDPEELEVALDKLTKPATNILYTNCISKLSIGGELFAIEFDTVLQCDENDVLILIMRGSGITKEDLVKKLEERNIPYSEVVFSNYEYKDYKEKLKEIWFARDASVLKEALTDSKKKENDVARYNPVIKGKLSLKHPGRPYLKEECEEIKPIITFKRIPIRGVIETEDKIILIINNLEDYNIYYKQALKVLSETGMTPVIEDYETFEKKDKAKQKVKTNRKINESGQA